MVEVMQWVVGPTSGIAVMYWSWQHFKGAYEKAIDRERIVSDKIIDELRADIKQLKQDLRECHAEHLKNKDYVISIVRENGALKERIAYLERPS